MSVYLPRELTHPNKNGQKTDADYIYYGKVAVISIASFVAAHMTIMFQQFPVPPESPTEKVKTKFLCQLFQAFQYIIRMHLLGFGVAVPQLTGQIFCRYLWFNKSGNGSPPSPSQSVALVFILIVEAALFGIANAFLVRHDKDKELIEKRTSFCQVRLALLLHGSTLLL